MKKTFTTLVLFLVLTQVSHATMTNVKIFGGSASFDETFDPAFSFGAGVEFLSNELGLEFSLGYLQTEQQDTSFALKTVPLSADLKLLLTPLQRSIIPYLGGGININFMSSNFDSPLLGYRVKGGLLFRLDPQSNLFIEAQKNFLQDDKNDAKLDHFTISAGFGVVLGDPSPLYQKKEIRQNQSRLEQIKSRIRNLIP